MKYILYSICFTVLAVGGIQGQSLEDDVNVQLMKAKVLFDAERYDEAVRIYNTIIKKNDGYAPAYLMRAKSKIFLGAWAGTRKDLLDFIDLNGVTKEVIKIMSITEYELGNLKSAKNYATTALEMDPYDGEQLFIAGNIEMKDKDKTQACEYWEAAAQMGARGAKTLVSKECSVIFEIREEQRQKKAAAARQVEAKKQAAAKRKAQALAKEKNEDDDMTDASKDKNQDDEEMGDTEVKSKSRNKQPIGIIPPKNIEVNEDVDEEEMIEDEPTEHIKEQNGDDSKLEYEKVDMDAIQEIEIDEELSVVIGNGLGKRKVEKHPDIFMLSNDAGKVVIDICVDHEGKVYSASIDKRKTTLFKTSLTSLALRKSKKFEFFPSFREEQCGFLIYVIKPGE